MNIKRCLLAATAAVSVAFALTPAAQAAEVTAARVAGDTPVGEVKSWDAPTSPTIATYNGQPNSWIKQVDHQKVRSYKVYSPSMDRDIPVAVVRATDGAGNQVNNAPIIYLLNGAGGAEQDADWLQMYDTAGFFAGEGVNVVIPQAGAFSYYTDWVRDDIDGTYVKGPQKWETFLTKELPGPIEKTLNADNRRAIVGFSMSGTSALVLPEHYPGFYDAAASFSGCASTSSPDAYNFARVTVNRGGNGDFRNVTPEMMWGPMGNDYNRWNDGLLNADKLRGTDLYISTATGLAGRRDQVSYFVGQGVDPVQAHAGAAVLQVEGGVIEAAINKCSHDLRAKLEHENIPANYKFRNVGTHSWPYWKDDIEQSWFETIKPSFGM